MYPDPISTFKVVDADHRARVRAASLRHRFADLAADSGRPRRATRLAAWRRAHRP